MSQGLDKGMNLRLTNIDLPEQEAPSLTHRSTLESRSIRAPLLSSNQPSSSLHNIGHAKLLIRKAGCLRCSIF